MIEDAGRGWRKVVPSPKPIDVVPKWIIRDLVQAGRIVIAAGGGGIPVIINNRGLFEGVEAVIDRLQSSRLDAGEHHRHAGCGSGHRHADRHRSQ